MKTGRTRKPRPRTRQPAVLFGGAGAIALAAIFLATHTQQQPETSPKVMLAASAKMVCTGVFVSGLDETRIFREDLDGAPAPAIQVDRKERTVRASAGTMEVLASFRDGLGCTVQVGDGKAPATAAGPGEPMLAEGDPAQPVPLPRKPDSALAAALDRAFTEDDPAHVKRTRAVLVIQHGVVIAERYAQGLSTGSRLPGYSMAKGVTDLLVGTAVKRGWLSLAQADLRPEWRVAAGDPRRAITLDQLLRMTSGLRWNEGYLGTDSDLMTMLTVTPDPAAFAAAKPMGRAPDGHTLVPGEHWLYAGGSYELVSRLLADSIIAHGANALTYPTEALFRPAGITSAVIEPAPDGVFMLSSFMLATASDWGRLGMLLLDANKNGPLASALFPPGWLAASVHPTVAAGLKGDRRMGAGIWSGSLGTNVPEGTFYLAGFEGQFIVVVPSMDLVVVRLGATPVDGNWTARLLMADLMPLLRADTRTGAAATSTDDSRRDNTHA